MEMPTMAASEKMPDTTIPTFIQPSPAPLPLIVPEELRDLGLEQQDKRVRIGHFVLWLAHSDYCNNRPEYHAAYPGGCTDPSCRTMTELVKHGKQCTAGDQCKVANCTLSKRIFSHCKVCTLPARCSVCEIYNYRRNRPQGGTLSVNAATAAVKKCTENLQRMAVQREQQVKPASKKIEPKDPEQPMSCEVESEPYNRFRNMTVPDMRIELEKLAAVTDELKELSRMFKENPAILPEFVEWMGSRQAQTGSGSGTLTKAEENVGTQPADTANGSGIGEHPAEEEKDENKEVEPGQTLSDPASYCTIS